MNASSESRSQAAAAMKVGTDDATNAVAEGNWSPRSGGDVFNWQAVLTLLGLLAVLGATAVGASSDRQKSTVEARVETLEKEVRQLRKAPE